MAASHGTRGQQWIRCGRWRGRWVPGVRVQWLACDLRVQWWRVGTRRRRRRRFPPNWRHPYGGGEEAGMGGGGGAFCVQTCGYIIIASVTPTLERAVDRYYPHSTHNPTTVSSCSPNGGTVGRWNRFAQSDGLRRWRECHNVTFAGGSCDWN